MKSFAHSSEGNLAKHITVDASSPSQDIEKVYRRRGSSAAISTKAVRCDELGCFIQQSFKPMQRHSLDPDRLSDPGMRHGKLQVDVLENDSA